MLHKCLETYFQLILVGLLNLCPLSPYDNAVSWTVIEADRQEPENVATKQNVQKTILPVNIHVKFSSCSSNLALNEDSSPACRHCWSVLISILGVPVYNTRVLTCQIRNCMSKDYTSYLLILFSNLGCIYMMAIRRQNNNKWLEM